MTEAEVKIINGIIDQLEGRIYVTERSSAPYGDQYHIGRGSLPEVFAPLLKLHERELDEAREIAERAVDKYAIAVEQLKTVTDTIKQMKK